MATFQNTYYKRTAATAKACYMCFRPTTTVLATIDTTDFFYACDGHLNDHGFATLIEPTPPHDVQLGQSKKNVNDEEIRRVKEEWEQRQRRKEKGKEQNKDNNEGSDKDKSKESEKSPVSSPKVSPSPPTPIPVPGSTAASRHKKYSLHREVFAMRLAEHRKKRQNTAVKEVAPRLPVTPRGGIA